MICVDESRMNGEAFVKGINENAGMTKAYYYECDLKKPDGVTEIVNKVTKEIGDISILLNCSTSHTAALYFSVSFPLLDKLMELKHVSIYLCRSLKRFYRS